MKTFKQWCEVKRHGSQSCDNCGREFTSQKIPGGSNNWECPHCKFDNKTGVEYARHASHVANQYSVEAAKKRKEAKLNNEINPNNSSNPE